MKMKKLMSIGALSLAIACCTSVTTFAAESAGNRETAIKNIAMKFYKGEKLSNKVGITINTPISEYATGTLIKEIKTLKIAGFDENKSIKVNLENMKENEESLKAGGLDKFKQFVNGKLDEFVKDSEDGTLESTVEKYIKVKNYGNLTTGKNMNGKTTVSLQDNAGRVILQVSSDNVYSVKSQLKGINSWGDLKDRVAQECHVDVNDILNSLKK